MIIGQIIAVIAGAAIVIWTIGSALRTVVLPRAVGVRLTRWHFRVIRRIFALFAPRTRPYEYRDRIWAMYAPVSLILLPATWATMILVAFTAIFWGVGVHPLMEAFATSGSSLVTLGFDRPPNTWGIALSFVEAGIGLLVVSLMISYLPSIYSAFRTREALVGMLEVRAGSPPWCGTLLARYVTINWLDHIQEDLFNPWEQWFVDVEESHTSQGSLPFFRSPTPERNWVIAAGCVLDSAALMASTVERRPGVRPHLLIRTGFLCLRRIADFYGAVYDRDPQPDDPISIRRRDFDLACIELTAAGVPLRADRDQAWRDFAGWRVNYDSVLLQLCEMVDAPPARWSSDRVVNAPSRRVLRRNHDVEGRHPTDQRF